jgi:hypothetical protein
MADTPTRQETVAANNAATITKCGEDAYWLRMLQMLEDISVSLAMLVDAGSGS